MNYRSRTDREDVERRQYRATWFGILALGIMCAFIFVAGSTSRFNNLVFMWVMSLLACPLSAWLATRCLMTAGAGSRLQAWIALALVVLVVIGQVVDLFPYFAASTWD